MTDYLISKSDLRETCWAEQPLPDLAEGMVRMKVEAFALTANNVTYAAFGDAMKYWNFFPAEEDTFGRVPVWGFATVEESKCEGVSPGQRVYGYLPISDRFDVRPVKVSNASFVDGCEHRNGLAPIYNTYIFTEADPGYDAAYEAQQMLFRPLFTTGWMIDDCLMENADTPPESVIISSASSKTAMALAECLKQRGGVQAVGLTSPGNKAFVEGTGLYARTLTYDEVPEMQARGTAAYVDFIGRPSLTEDVHHALRDRLIASMVIGVTDWEGDRTPRDLPGPKPELFFVPTYAATRAKEVGPEKMNAKLGAALAAFYPTSKNLVTPVYVEGQDAISKAWVDTLDRQIGPDQGLILKL